MSNQSVSLVLAVLLASLNLATAQSTPPRFIAPISISPEPQNTDLNASWNVYDIAADDIDGDGKPDLVISVQDETNLINPPNFLEFLKGNGNGTFIVKKFSLTTPNYPLFVLLADLNGDGYLDLVTTGFVPAEVDVYLGNGDGTFKNPLRYLQNLPVTTPVISNLNNDQRPDIAVLSQGTVKTLINQGDGTFRVGQGLSVFPSTNAFGALLGAADFNGDRHTDLLVSDGTHARVLIGHGDGTFSLGASITLPSHLSYANHPAQITDVNRDGRPDVVFSLADRAQVLLGNGNGTFRGTSNLQKPLRYVSGIDTGVTGALNVAAGDFNHDRNPDFVVGPFVYLGNGDGTFRISKFYAVSGSPEIAYDVNNDGNTDLIWVNQTDCCGGYVNVALGSKGGLFNAPLETVAADRNVNPNTPRDPQSIVSGDFNRDGIRDIAVRCQVEKLCIFPGTGKGYFDSLTLYPVTFSGVLAVGDINNDGFLDIVGTNYPTSGSGNYDVVVLLGNGDGTFKAAEKYLDLNTSNVGRFAFLLDINNDHKLDLVGSFGVALGNGDGTFQPAKPLPEDLSIYDMAWGDFNRDGFIDLAVSSQGIGHILLGDGSGTFAKEVPFNPSTGMDGLAVADVNKDGIPDVLFSSSRPLGLAVALGRGNGTFGTPAIYPYSAHYCCFDGDKVMAADFDHDGISDVIVTTYSHIEYFKGLTGGTFAPPQEYANTQNADAVPPYDVNQYTFLDMNGDGYLDIAITDQVLGMSRLLNTGLPAN